MNEHPVDDEAPDERTEDSSEELGHAADARVEHGTATRDRLGLGPPLILIVVVAGLAEFIFARFAWHGLSDAIARDSLLRMNSLARLPRNVAALGGLIAFGFAIVDYLRLPGIALAGRRLAVAAFAGVLFPSLVVATFLPITLLRARLVVFAIAAASVFAALVGMTATRYRAPLPVRFAVFSAVLSALLSLTVMSLGQLLQTNAGVWAYVAAFAQQHASGTQTFANWVRIIGEVAWLAVLMGLAWELIGGGDRAKRTIRSLSAVALFGVSLVALFIFQDHAGQRFAHAIYGGMRLVLLLDINPSLYILPLSIAMAAIGIGLFRDAPHRQLAAGTLLWLVAGFAPHAPIQVLYFALAILLLTRSAQALEAEGKSNGWAVEPPWRVRNMARAVAAPPAESDPAIEQETFDDL